MSKVLLREEHTYESTSDEWKEYIHTVAYYFDTKTKKVVCEKVTEFDDTRSLTRTLISKDVVEVDRSALPSEVEKMLPRAQKQKD